MYENQKSIFYHIIIVQNLYFDGIIVEHSFPQFQVGEKTFIFYIIGNCMIVEETAQSKSCFVMLLLLVYFPYLTSWGNEIKMICIKASKNVSSFISEHCYWRVGGTPWDSWNKSQLFLIVKCQLTSKGNFSVSENFCPGLLGRLFFCILGELKKSKSPFEINWPLEMSWLISQSNYRDHTSHCGATISCM